MKICVFGAASDIIDEKYKNAAYQLGCAMAKRNIGLVFGGGSSGVMGATVKGVHDNGGYMLGVAPEFMKDYNILYTDCTEFKYTETMAQRKSFMEDSSDGFIIAPGGIGTYEEFFEVFTLKQLDRHNKPICIFNCFGYYDKMLEMLGYTVEENFLQDESMELIKVFDDAEAMIDYLEGYEAGDIDVLKIRYNK